MAAERGASSQGAACPHRRSGPGRRPLAISRRAPEQTPVVLTGEVLQVQNVKKPRSGRAVVTHPAFSTGQHARFPGVHRAAQEQNLQPRGWWGAGRPRRGAHLENRRQLPSALRTGLGQSAPSRSRQQPCPSSRAWSSTSYRPFRLLNSHRGNRTC